LKWISGYVQTFFHIFVDYMQFNLLCVWTIINYTLFRLSLNRSFNQNMFFLCVFRTPVGAYAWRPAPAPMINNGRRWLSANHRMHSHRMGGQALFAGSVCMREASSILTWTEYTGITFSIPSYINIFYNVLTICQL